VPLDFLRRKKPDTPAPTPEPEDVSAEDFLVRITYAAKSSEGVRMTAGPSALAALPTILFGVAGESRRSARGRVLAGAASSIPRRHSGERPQRPEPGGSARHRRWRRGCPDLAFGTRGGARRRTDTSGTRSARSSAGRVALGRATGDMIVRGVVGWGGKGARGGTDRGIAARGNLQQHPGEPVYGVV
jgi:hypothetical protein